MLKTPGSNVTKPINDDNFVKVTQEYFINRNMNLSLRETCEELNKLLGNTAQKKSGSDDNEDTLMQIIYKWALVMGPTKSTIDPNAKAISNFLILVEKECENITKAFNVARFLLSLGRVTKKINFYRSNKSDKIKKIVGKLLDRVISELSSYNITQIISNTLLGLGYIAQQGVKFEEVQTTLLLLIEKLPNLEPKAQEISTAILGLGYIAQQGVNFEGVQETLLSLIEKLPNLEPKAQEISNTILGLGYIAQQGVKFEEVQKTLLSLLTNQVNLDWSAQAISNTILGLGYMAQQGVNFEGGQKTLLSLIEKLLGLKPKAQNISNTILGLGYMAQQGVNFKEGQKILLLLIEKLSSLELNAQDISTAILGLGYMAQQGVNFEGVQNELLTLMEKLLILNPSAQEISNAVYAYYWLLNFPATELELFEQFQTKFLQMVKEDVSLKNKRHFASQIAQSYCRIDKDLPQELRQELENHKPQPQTLQTEIVNHFGSSITIKAEALVGAWFVDLYIEINGQKIIIEIDGPQHYTKTGELRVEDEKRDNWLRGHHYEVKRFYKQPEQIKELKPAIIQYIQQELEKTSTATSSLADELLFERFGIAFLDSSESLKTQSQPPSAAPSREKQKLSTQYYAKNNIIKKGSNKILGGDSNSLRSASNPNSFYNNPSASKTRRNNIGAPTFQ